MARAVVPAQVWMRGVDSGCGRGVWAWAGPLTGHLTLPARQWEGFPQCPTLSIESPSGLLPMPLHSPDAGALGP